VDVDRVLEAYDTQLRRSTEPPAPAGSPSGSAAVVRLTSPSGDWGDGIFWSDLDEATADDAIAAAIAYFGGLGRSFEWKHHGYDAPADLPARLEAAGFVAEPTETIVVGGVAEVLARCASASPPEGVTLRHLRDDSDWDRIAQLHGAVWDRDATGHTRELATEHAAAPEAMSVHLAEADGQVVCAGWIRFAAGTDFASLWGGSTLAPYRRRGIYRALVARRAAEAAERGFRYLQVDASDDSRPILERLGLHRLTTTTPYIWSPHHAKRPTT
jgi:GNAT superfamily N-acetyltransferase